MALRGLVKVWAENSPSLGNVFKPTLNNTADLNALRQQVIQLRTAYWMRKTMEYGKVWGAAKEEFKQLVFQLRHAPTSFTGRDLGVAAVWGIHIYGSFIVGEMLGRASINGYAQGRLPAHEGI